MNEEYIIIKVKQISTGEEVEDTDTTVEMAYTELYRNKIVRNEKDIEKLKGLSLTVTVPYFNTYWISFALQSFFDKYNNIKEEMEKELHYLIPMTISYE